MMHAFLPPIIYLLFANTYLYQEGIADQTNQNHHYTIADLLIFKDIDGNNHDIHKLINKGSNVAFLFWKPSCSSSRMKLLELRQSARLHGDHIKFFGIVIEEDKKLDNTYIKQLTTKFKLPFPQILDENLLIKNRFQIRHSPTLIILGPERSVLYAGFFLPNEWRPYFYNALGNDRQTTIRSLKTLFPSASVNHFRQNIQTF